MKPSWVSCNRGVVLKKAFRVWWLTIGVGGGVHRPHGVHCPASAAGFTFSRSQARNHHWPTTDVRTLTLEQGVEDQLLHVCGALHVQAFCPWCCSLSVLPLPQARGPRQFCVGPDSLWTLELACCILQPFEGLCYCQGCSSQLPRASWNGPLLPAPTFAHRHNRQVTEATLGWAGAGTYVQRMLYLKCGVLQMQRGVVCM